MFDKPFFEVTLPLMVTVLVSVWAAISTNNRRLDDMKSDLNRHFDEMLKRLDKIDARLDKIDAGLQDHGTPLTKLHARAWR